MPDLENFELVTEMGGLVENLPDMTEIMYPKGFFCGRKDVGVEGEEIGEPVAFYDAPNVKIFEPGAKFAAILVTYKIGAASDIGILLDMLNETSERTLAPTKRSLDDDATHSDMNTFE